jgi:non-specific serine/threonine protein kinase
MIQAARPAYQTRRDMGPWLDRFEEEHDNIRSVLDWQLATGEAATALELCGGLYWFWYIRGYLAEGRARIERALEMSPGAPAQSRSRAYLGAAMMAHWQGDDERAVPWVTEAIELARQCGDEYGAVFGMGVLALVAEDSGQFEEAVEPLERALELAEQGGFPPTVALIMDHLGVVAWGRGQQEQAIAFWEKGLAIHRDIGDLWGASIALSYLGIAACERRDPASALPMLRESLVYRWEMRNTEDVAHGLSNLAMVAVAAGEFERAARLFGTAESTHELIGNPVKEPERSIYERSIDKARAGMDPTSFQEAWTAGRALNLETAVGEAMAPIELARGPDARPYDLTARELEILKLIAVGKSDREIGDELFISTRTAQTHVSHILGKLGVSSRSAATNMAIREGIANF